MSATPVVGSFEGLSDIKLVGRQVRYEQLSFWLNPIGAIFTVGFSVVFLILLGASAGIRTFPSTGIFGWFSTTCPGLPLTA
jgi:hypothetical protein